MKPLRIRLGLYRTDILAFRLSVHEMCADLEPIALSSRDFHDFSPDDPAATDPMIFPCARTLLSVNFDPLELVLQSAEALMDKVVPVFSDRLLPYEHEGKLVTRRFDCRITFVTDASSVANG